MQQVACVAGRKHWQLDSESRDFHAHQLQAYIDESAEARAAQDKMVAEWKDNNKDEEGLAAEALASLKEKKRAIEDDLTKLRLEFEQITRLIKAHYG